MICSSCFCGTPFFFSSPGFNVSTIPDISDMPGSFYLFQFCERSEHSLDSEPVKVHGDLIVSAAFRNALYHSHSEFYMADCVSHSIVQRIRLGDRKLPGLKSFRGIFFLGTSAPPNSSGFLKACSVVPSRPRSMSSRESPGQSGRSCCTESLPGSSAAWPL